MSTDQPPAEGGSTDQPPAESGSADQPPAEGGSTDQPPAEGGSVETQKENAIETTPTEDMEGGEGAEKEEGPPLTEGEGEKAEAVSEEQGGEETTPKQQEQQASDPLWLRIGL